MRRSLAFLIPAVLMAQAPAPQAAYNASERFRTEGPALDKLLAEFQYPEALAKAESLLPPDGALPAFEKVKAGGTYASYATYYAIGRLYFNAGRAAQYCGQWEKALEYFTKAKDVAKQNADLSKEAFKEHIANLKQDTLLRKGQLDGNADVIKELREKEAKGTLNAEEKQQMDMVKSMDTGIASNEKWSANFQKAVDHAAGEAKAMESYPGDVKSQIDAQIEDLDKYKFKNDKVKFVEGYMASKPYMDQLRAMDKSNALANLYRFRVLSPDNKKVQAEIDRLMGKTVETSAPAKKDKKGKK